MEVYYVDSGEENCTPLSTHSVVGMMSEEPVHCSQ